MIEVFPPSLHTLPFLRTFGRRAVPAEPRSNGVSPGGAVSRQLTNRALDESFIQEAGSDNLSLMGESRATHPKRALIIPALNEEESIGRAIAAVPRGLFDEIIVVDNGSLDATAEKASQAGARVLAEPRRGYGRACWTGIQSLAEGIETLVFMDADLSDDPQDAQRLVDALEKGPYDMVVGSRALGKADPGALEPWQRFGNWLATRVIGLLWGVHYTDLGPFRAIRMEALRKLDMRDRGFGWTVEMQARAAQLGMRTCEIPVRYRVRAYGGSKISGNLVGSFKAGITILQTLLRCAFAGKRPAGRW